MAPAPGTDEPLTPIGNGSLATVSLRHFGGIGLNLMLAIPTPYDKANIGSRSIPERHQTPPIRDYSLFGLEKLGFRNNVPAPLDNMIEQN